MTQNKEIDFPTDIYTEPEFDPNTLDNLGPLKHLAGTFKGDRGMDTKPKADGPRNQGYFETITLVPIDPQTNGPQLFYGLRYFQHITKPNRIATYHEQVGYLLWEPRSKQIIQTLTIPRGMTAIAYGMAEETAMSFSLASVNEVNMQSNPFLEHAFKTMEYNITFTIHDHNSWSYHQDTVLKIVDQDDLFHHIDDNTLARVGKSIQNPKMGEMAKN